jgi:peptidoglycan-N-acetylglucosamine deacetylase
VGQKIIWYRPPVGHVSPRTAAAVRMVDVELVTWSVRCLDGLKRSRPACIAGCIRRKLHDGAIVMLHDAAERGDFIPAGVQAIDAIFDTIAGRGYRGVTLSELLVFEGTKNTLE